MASGAAVVDGWIRGLRKLPREARAENLRGVVEEHLRGTVRAGTSPDGVPWPERKEGGRALQNADAALTVAVSGSVIVARVAGPEAIHNFGTGKDPKRQILPERLPTTLAGKLKRFVFERFRAVLGVS